ncbi:MAG: 4'-phosphopantetheinyl transferase superfamily protein [Bacteroidetes bacterium]|nr:4'-phosphopantetheinyl transferase superfamily protein [Bacteroidota bacterium]
MGLWIKKDVGNGAFLALWQMEEDEVFFTENLDLQEVEQAELAPLKGRRRLEWLASRWLVHEMLLGHGYEDRVPVLKDEFGKPHLWGTPFHLSFSHSHEVVAVILAKKPTGIDIQRLVPKIEVLAHKFLRPEELASLQPATRLEHLHVYWGAKEALFKAHGRRQLDFRQHILMEPFDYQPVGSTTGRVCKDDFDARFDVFFEKMDEYVLVWCV